MTAVVNALSELLFERDAVTVPGLGTFSCDYESAKVNVVTNQFEQPSATIRFNPQLREENDQLAALLAARDGITPEEARQQLVRFVADCFATLKEGRAFELPGIGTLTASGGPYPHFEPVRSNFNADAFGLCDIHPEPVFVGTQEERKPRVNVPQDLGDEERFRRQHRRRWLPALLWTLFMAFAVLLLLFFLEVIKFPFSVKPKPVPSRIVTVPIPDSAMQAQLVSYYPVVAEEIEVLDTIPDAQAEDTLVEPVVKEPEPAVTQPEPVANQPEPKVEQPNPVVNQPKPVVNQPEPVVTPSGMPVLPYAELLPYSVIAGCFSQQVNAENYIKPILEQGHQSAFLMQKGAMYYVCYGQYATMDEAKAAMATVKTDPNNKAWILTK